jgi:class 3 adenylate cyclase
MIDTLEVPMQQPVERRRAAILAADAARCAVEIGRAVVRHNAEAPEKKRIAFRTGLNLGEIFADRRDINGDGVNIAARSGGGAIVPRFMVCFTASQ